MGGFWRENVGCLIVRSDILILRDELFYDLESAHPRFKTHFRRSERSQELPGTLLFQEPNFGATRATHLACPTDTDFMQANAPVDPYLARQQERQAARDQAAGFTDLARHSSSQSAASFQSAPQRTSQPTPNCDHEKSVEMLS